MPGRPKLLLQFDHDALRIQLDGEVASFTRESGDKFQVRASCRCCT